MRGLASALRTARCNPEALTIGRLARGMALPAPGRLLLAPARLLDAPAPRSLAAGHLAVAIPPVAPRAQVHHRAAQVADKPTAIGTQGQASWAWTPTPKPAMISVLGASAPGSRGGRRSCHRRSPSPACFVEPQVSPEKPAHTTHPPPGARDDDAD